MSSYSSFNYIAAYIAHTVLTGLPIPVLLTFWGLSLKSLHPRPVSPPLRLALLFLRIATPIYALGLIFSLVNPAVLTALSTDSYGPRDYLTRAYDASIYLSYTGAFLANTADIGLTMVLYLATIGTVYVTQGKMTWWKLFRVDAPVGGALLMVLNIAWFGRSMTLLADPESSRRADRWLGWLVFIVDMTLALLAAGCLGTMIYVLSKLAQRGFEGLKVALGKVPTLLLVSSILWLVRCCYGVADIVKNIRLEYLESLDDARAWLFVYPLFQHWFVTAVTGLLLFAVRNSVWSDASIQPTTSNPVVGGPGQPYQQPPGPFYPAPGQQVPPMMAQQPQQYPYPGQPIPMASPGAGPVPVQYIYPPPGQQQAVYYTNAPQPPVVQQQNQ